MITWNEIHPILPLIAVQWSILPRKAARKNETLANIYSAIHTCHYRGRLPYILVNPFIIECIPMIRMAIDGHSGMGAVGWAEQGVDSARRENSMCETFCALAGRYE
jgi:hypothetical protein